jgi:hypothetical protein
VKAFLFSIILFSVSQVLLAQKGLSVGVDVTIQHTGYSSWTNFKPFNNIAIRPSVGLRVDYYFTEWFGLGSGAGININTMDRPRFSNNFTYLDIPLHLKLNIPVLNQSTNEIRSLSPALILGMNNQFLARAVNRSDEGKESIRRFSEKYHWELVGGMGIKIRLKDNLFLDNYFLAAMGNPATSVEYNSNTGAITNLNLGIRTGLRYWLDAPNN